MRSGNHQQPPTMSNLSHSSHSSPHWPGQNTNQNPSPKAPHLFPREPSHTPHLLKPTSASTAPRLPYRHPSSACPPSWFGSVYSVYSVVNRLSPFLCQSIPLPKSKAQYTTHHHRIRHFPSPMISVMSASHQRLKNPSHSLRTPAPLLSQSFLLPFCASLRPPLRLPIPPSTIVKHPPTTLNFKPEPLNSLKQKPRLPHGKRGP